jgi:DNA-binding HxlR family transcriptional regulator
MEGLHHLAPAPENVRTMRGPGPPGDYCSFTKAVEHLGDRWSLLIVRELLLAGTMRFNTLAANLPGISRSVLASRLRKLAELGLLERAPASGARMTGYSLTPAGEQLKPVLLGLWSWAERWVPEDPAMIERDPDVISVWLARRADPALTPPQRAVIEVSHPGRPDHRAWLVVERGARTSICLEDPALAPERYVYIEAQPADLAPVARGQHDWHRAIADGSISVYGDPDLVRAMPGWFLPPATQGRSGGPRGIAARASSEGIEDPEAG